MADLAQVQAVAAGAIDDEIEFGGYKGGRGDLLDDGRAAALMAELQPLAVIDGHFGKLSFAGQIDLAPPFLAGGDVVIDLGRGNSVRLVSVDIDNLTTGDFIF